MERQLLTPEEIEITTGMNGYPEGLHKGYIGFSSFEEAKRFAEDHDGNVVSFRKRNGWQFWESQGRMYDLYEVDSDTYGDDYSTEYDREVYEAGCRERISQLVADEASLDDIAAILKDMCDIADRIDKLEEDEAVLLYRGGYCDTIKTRTMLYSEDVWTYSIGVEVFGHKITKED